MFMGLFSRKQSPIPVMTDGRRVYAIGDIHGRLDLLEMLLSSLEADSRERGPADVVVVLLGDLIDRGPASQAVIRRAMQPLGWAELVCLKGNHEAAMEAALAGDLKMAAVWLRNGGIEALRSWGVDPELLEHGETEQILAEARRLIPFEQQQWIARLPINYRIGDYFFVHAGIRPGVPLYRQSLDDQLWIRDEFLDNTADHGAVIIHGHSMADGVDERRNRVGLDTGAYLSGRLTAMGVESDERWFLQSQAGPASPPVGEPR